MVKTKYKFNEDKFDAEVAKSISVIQNTRQQMIKSQQYESWYNNNYVHLENMYNLSKLEWDFPEFCVWVYNFSK